MDGLQIIVKTLSQSNVTDRRGNRWQYFSRSDHHSKTTCWAFLFDLIRHCRLLREHIRMGSVGFGINHEMRDFRLNKKKDLDLVICRPRPGSSPAKAARTFATLANDYGIALSAVERSELAALPDFGEVPVGSVLLALEAKAAMTAHVKACPRLFDELNSSHQIVHGDSGNAIAAGLVLVNYATNFVSPDSNKTDLTQSTAVVSKHKQPDDSIRVVQTVGGLPRRSNVSETGFDGIATILVDCRNDGSAVKLVTDSPAPEPGSILHYESLVGRVCHLYQSRFPQV